MLAWQGCLYLNCAVLLAMQDPIFKGNKVPNPEMGYPGGAPQTATSRLSERNRAVT